VEAFQAMTRPEAVKEHGCKRSVFLLAGRFLAIITVAWMARVHAVAEADAASKVEFEPARLRVSGFGLLGNWELRKIIRLAQGEDRRPEFWDANFLEDSVLILLSHMTEEGYLEPRVQAQVTLPDGSYQTFEWDKEFDTVVPRDLLARRVHFRAQRGVRFFYRQVEITGLRSIRRAPAERYFISAESLIPLKGTRIYTPTRLNRSIANLEEALIRRGFAHARVEIATFQRNDQTGAVRVHVIVEEGLPHVVGSMVTEIRPVDATQAPERTMLRLETPYSRYWAQDFAYGLRTNQYRRGHPDVTVSMDTVRRETNETQVVLDLEARVDPGPRVRVGEVRWEGNRRTRDRVLDHRIRLEPGDWLNPLEAERGRQRIARLGIFDRVDLRYEEAEEGVRDVVYEVRESRTFELSLLFGYGSYEMLRGGVEMEQRNVLGLAHDVRLRGMQSFKATSGDFHYTIPEMFGEDIDLFTGASGLRREEVSFVREEYGGGAGVRRSLRPIQSDVTFRYDIEVVTAREQDPAVIEQVGLREARVGAFVLDLHRDRRDNPLVPRRGLKVFGTLELASEALGGQVDYQRFIVGGSYHLRLGGGRYLHAGITHGVSLTGGGRPEEFPFNKRFFPGGENSVRGYQQGEASPLDANGEVIGAETFLQGNLEFEQLLTPSWSLVAFADGVGIARRRADYPYDETLYSVGGGVRWRTLIGPVRLEYGHNLNPRSHDPKGTLHFSIGFPF
jgi:outer membrane protein insertion porin family